MTKRFRKNLILSIAAGLVVLLLVPILALQYLDWNPHRDRLGRWISASLNRSVAIAGPLEIQLWPVAQLKVGGLQIASPDEGFKSPLLDIGTASIDLNLGALFSKTLLIDHLEVDSSSLSLQILADGRTNWNFRGADPSQADNRAGWTTIVRVAEINDVKLSFLGKNPRFNQRWDIHKLRSSLPEGRNESALVLRGLYNGTPLSIDGSLTLLGDDDLEAALRVDLGASSGTVSGLVKDVMDGGEASLAIQLETSNLSETVTTFIPGATERARELLMGKGSASAVLKGRFNESLRLEDVEWVTESELLRMTSSGDVGLWRRGQGLLPKCDLGVFLETQALSELVTLFGGNVPFDAKAEARGILRGSLRDFRFDDAIFEAVGPLVEISGSGRLERMGSDSGMWLDFETKVGTLDVGRLMSAYRLSLPFDGTASATARVWGGRGGVRVDNIQTEIASGTGNLRLAGAIGPLGPSAKYQLPFEGSSRDLRNELSGFGWEIPDGWAGSIKGLLAGDQVRLFARDLDIELSSKIMTVSLGGSVGPLGSLAVYQLPFRAATPDFRAVASLLGKTLPFSGSASVQGILTGQKTELSVTGLNAQVRNELGLLRLDGELGLAGESPNMEISAELTVPTVAALQPLTKFPLADYAGVSLTMSSEVFRVKDKIGVRHISGVLRGEGIKRGRISGRFPDVARLRSGSLAVDLELDHLGRLGKGFGFKEGSKVPGRLAASLVGSEKPEDPFFVSVEGFTQGIQLKVNGRLADLDAGSHFDLASQLLIQDAKFLSGLIDREIPLDGPLRVDLSVRRDASSAAKHPLKGKLSIKAQEIEASVQGDIGWPISSGTKLQAHIETASLQNLRRWLPEDLLDPGPVSLDGNLEFLESGAQQAEFSILVGNNDLTGSVMLGAGLLPGTGTSVQGTAPLKVVGDIWSSRLNLMEIFPTPPPEELPEAKAEETETRGSIFSNQPFSLDWIAPLAVDLDFQSKELVTRRFKANNLITEIDINDGVLTLRSDAGEFSGGSFDLDLKLDSTEKPYPVSMSFSIKGLIAREIPALKNSRLPLEGSVDVDIEVESKGVSAKEIAANANGEMKGSGLNTYFPATGMDILTQSILAQILGVVDPKRRNEFHVVQCGVIGFRVVDGIVMSRDTIVIQTEDVTFLIRGGVSLIDESIVFLIRPKARGGVGISASSLTNFYRVGGTLSQPKIQADLEGVLKTGATWGLAAATGGLSLIAQGLFDKVRANQDVCAIAEENYETLLAEDGAALVKIWERLQQ